MVFILLCNLAASCAVGQDADVIVDQHVWARFGVGSWKLVRSFAENLDESGKVQSVSITEEKTTLASADENGYTLKVEVAVEVAGKRFQADPQELTYGYNGEINGQTVTTKDIGEAKLKVAGLEYPTLKRLILIEAENLRSVSTTYYSANVSPHTLKRTTEATDPKTNQKTYRAEVEVFAIEMPRRVLTETKPTSHVRKVETYPNGDRKVTVEVLCDSVPGGLVAHTMKQVDDSGLTVKRSTLDLIDYQVIARPATPAKVVPAARRGGLLRRRRKAG
jgi:hypothetical protein